MFSLALFLIIVYCVKLHTSICFLKRERERERERGSHTRRKITAAISRRITLNEEVFAQIQEQITFSAALNSTYSLVTKHYKCKH